MEFGFCRKISPNYLQIMKEKNFTIFVEKKLDPLSKRVESRMNSREGKKYINNTELYLNL